MKTYPRADAGPLGRFLRVMQSPLPQVVVAVGVFATERVWNLPLEAASGLAFLFWGHRGQGVIDGGEGSEIRLWEGLGLPVRQ